MLVYDLLVLYQKYLFSGLDSDVAYRQAYKELSDKYDDEQFRLSGVSLYTWYIHFYEFFI